MLKTVNNLILVLGCLILGLLSCDSSDNPGINTPDSNEEQQRAAAIAALPRAQVNIQTQYGDLKVELFNETPQHRDNFLKLVKAGFYDRLAHSSRATQLYGARRRP